MQKMYLFFFQKLFYCHNAVNIHNCCKEDINGVREQFLSFMFFKIYDFSRFFYGGSGIPLRPTSVQKRLLSGRISFKSSWVTLQW